MRPTRVSRSSLGHILLALLVTSCVCHVSLVHSAEFSYPQPETEDSLEYYEYLLDELDHRRRLQFLFPNPQTIFDGLPIGYTQTVAGNLTFERRDLVLLGQESIVLSRIYDSRFNLNVGLGTGWRLNIAETIELIDGIVIYTDENGARHRFSYEEENLYTVLAQSPMHRDTSIFMIGHAATLMESKGTIRHFRQVEDSSVFVLVRRTSVSGQTISLKYDGLKLLQVASNENPVLKFDWSGDQLVRVSDFNYRQVEYEYDAQGRLETVTDIGQQSWKYAYDLIGRLVLAAHPDGQPYLKVEYDETGKVARSLAARDYTYHYFEGTTTVIEPTGNRHEFKHNDSGITIGYRNGFDLEWSLRLDELNRPIELDRNRKVYRFHYKASRIASIHHSEGSLHLHYDSKDRYTHSSGTPIHGYEPKRVSYDEGDSVLVTDTNMDFRYVLDDSRRLQSITENGDTFHIGYDLKGFVSSLKQGESKVEFERNALGRIISASFPGNVSSQYQYDNLGNRDEVEFFTGASMSIRHDGRGNIRHVVDTSKDGVALVQSYSIDHHNRVTRVAFAESTELNVLYDDFGRPKTFKESGKIVEVEYLGNGNPVRVRSGQITRKLHRGYDDAPFLQINPSPRRFLHNDERILSQREYGAIHISLDSMDVRIVPIEFDAVPSYLEAASNLLTMKSWLSETNRGQIEKPSNPVFQPPEYESTNCCLACNWDTKCGQYCTAIFGTGELTCQCSLVGPLFNSPGGSGGGGGSSCVTNDRSKMATARETLETELSNLDYDNFETALVVNCPNAKAIAEGFTTTGAVRVLCVKFNVSPNKTIYTGHTHPFFEWPRDQEYGECGNGAAVTWKSMLGPTAVNNRNIESRKCGRGDIKEGTDYPLLLRTPHGRIKKCGSSTGNKPEN